ncbi:hypothetical protein GCM10023219_24550 [Stakelama sediminis]|uniref:Uncharacterized protein n=1 Tax=Stakelama sediminis TaxID=463200 RepID=A0A840YZ97_9SPHN|nr:hypothetical protein [Stakelama sediminis]MBB5718867.1 hypothetical protein [Stakelama sediminis]
MNQDPPSDTAPEKPAAPDPKLPKPDASAERNRKRWFTLAEILGIAALLISGATLWNNVRMRESQEAARSEAQVREAHAKQIARRDASLVTLDGTARHDGKVLALQDMAGHRIQTMQVRFPASLDIAAQRLVLDPEIKASWFASKILDLTDGGPDRVEGQLPVEITSEYWDHDNRVTDSAIYDVVFNTEGRLIGGRKLKLKGVVLNQRVSGDAGARLDNLWTAERKRLQSKKK